MPTKTKAPKVAKPANEVVSFYGGKAQIEIVPWGDHFRFKDVSDKTRSLLSVTGATKYLDKSRALLPWAVRLVGSHISQYVENGKSGTFTREELVLVIGEAILKPESAKVEGGLAGDAIHTFAHEFAKAKITHSPLPTIDHLDEKVEHDRKVLNGINAFLDWYNSRNVEFLAMEKLVYYNSLLAGDTKAGEPVIEFVGLIDLVARVDGVVEVIDYKTSKGVYSDQQYQVGGYTKAWNREACLAYNLPPASRSRILNFSKETGELIQKEMTLDETAKDFSAFAGLYHVALREKELDAEWKASKKA